MPALVSVIVPIYGVEQYLERCIKSIQNQTYNNLEILLVDDGSPDNCGEICDKYAEKDSRIRVIHKQNGGLSDARNAGIEVASGEYYFLLDSDDWIHNQTIEIMMRMITDNNCDLAICGYQYAYEGKEYADKKLNLTDVLGQYKQVNSYRAQEIYFTNPDKRLEYTVAWNKIYHKDLFNNIRYPKGKVHEDEFTTFKLLHEAGNIGIIKEPLYYYFVRNDSIMGEFKASRFDAFDGYLEKMRFYMKWNYSELATKSLLHAMHMLCQYNAWNEAKKKELCNLVNQYRKKIISTVKECEIPLKGKVIVEYVLFTSSFGLYYNVWKFQRK